MYTSNKNNLNNLNLIAFIVIVAILIINLGMLVSCEPSKELSDYNCDKGFQKQFDLCMDEKPDNYSTSGWVTHCKQMTIATHCHERENNFDNGEEQIDNTSLSREPVKKYDDNISAKNYQGNYNGKKVECLNGILYYSIESYEKDKLSPVYQASSKPRLVLCKE